jgi:uridine kinase
MPILTTDSPYERDIADRGHMDEVLTDIKILLKPNQQFIEPTKAFADIIIPMTEQYGCH